MQKERSKRQRKKGNKRGIDRRIKRTEKRTKKERKKTFCSENKRRFFDLRRGQTLKETKNVLTHKIGLHAIKIRKTKIHKILFCFLESDKMK